MRASPSRTTLAFLLCLACGGGGGDSGGTQPPPPPPGTLTLSVPNPNVAVAVGASASVSLAITRGGSFSGTVTLSLGGAPNGVTGTFAPATLDPSATSATLTLTAAPTASPGQFSLTITATGSGVSTQSATLTLVVSQPAIALGITPTSLSLAQGLTGQATVSIGRSAGYVGAVALVLDAPPAGISGTFAPSPTTGNSSQLTLAISPTTAPGSYSVRVKATGAGVQDQVVTLALTVTASLPVGFTGVVDPVEFELPAGRGWNTSGIVSIQRVGGFNGAVGVSVQGLSLPAFVGVTPSTLAAGQTMANTLALTIDGGAPGVYSGVVRLTAAGYAEQQIPIRVRISAPTTGSITWNFCNGVRNPRYLAVRDGNGPWQHIVASGPWGATQATPASYSFNVSSPTASVAIVRLGEKTSANNITEGFYWNIFHLTRQELLDLAAEECITNRDATTRRFTASVTGYQSFDAILASISRFGLASVGSTGPLTTTLTAQNVDAGPFDLLLSRTRFVPAQGPDLAVTAIVLRRGLDPAAGAVIPAVDFAGEGVAPATAPLTFANTGGEAFTNAMTFRTATGLNAWLVASGQFTPTARPWWGVPTARLVTGDLHQVTATTGSVAARRQVIHFSREVKPTTLTFGAALSMPQVTGAFTPAGGIDFAGTLGPDYTSRVSLYFRDGPVDPRTGSIVATRGFLGGQTQYDVRWPNLTGLSGFTQFWMPRRGATAQWTVTGGEGGIGDRSSDSFCVLQGLCPVRPVDGATYKSAQATGTVVIP